MENDIYILNPEYVMRNDKYRILLYSKKSNTYWKCYLHPMQAKILSFFTQGKSLYATVKSLSLYFNKSENDIMRIVEPFIENEKILFTSWNGVKIKFPPKVLIKKTSVKYDMVDIDDLHCDLIDLKTKRCLAAPLGMTLILTNTCVTNCCYCYADKKKQDYIPLSTNRILEIIEEAYSLKMKSVLLIGGEVFLHKDWYIILDKILKRNMSTIAISTKMPITEDIIFKLKKSNFCDVIQLSIDSLDPVVLKKTLSVKDVYIEKIKKGISLLDKSGIKYQIVTVLTKYNVDYYGILDLYNYIKNLKNIVGWRILPTFKSLYINNNSFDNIKSTREEIEELFEKIKMNIIPYAEFNIILDRGLLDKKFQKCENGCQNFTGGKCGILQDQITVLPDGKVTLCDQLYWNRNFIIGDLTTESIVDVWTSKRANTHLVNKRENIQKTSSCKTCEFFDTCFSYRCRVDVVKAYGNENLDFPDPRCVKAPLMVNNISY